MMRIPYNNLSVMVATGREDILFSDTSVSDTSIPGTSVSGATVPSTGIPGTSVSDTSIHGTSAPDILPVLLIHGAGMDRTTWGLQTRKLAHENLQPLAIDLPGHGATGGDPLESIDAMAAWCHGFMRHLNRTRYVAIGHSMGGLVAATLASQYNATTQSDTACVAAILVGVADNLAVSPALLDAAKTAPQTAAEMIVDWSFHSKTGGQVEMPGISAAAQGRQLISTKGRRALASDLQACVDFGAVVPHMTKEVPIA
ncbi:MAG: alpha/beta fold hydrolase, partial [Alphaproteobacteria bacterium]|nr:alpha/beta fold hydrolase [Alphaproteobacteria bacterium]